MSGGLRRWAVRGRRRGHCSARGSPRRSALPSDGGGRSRVVSPIAAVFGPAQRNRRRGRRCFGSWRSRSLGGGECPGAVRPGDRVPVRPGQRNGKSVAGIASEPRRRPHLLATVAAGGVRRPAASEVGPDGLQPAVLTTRRPDGSAQHLVMRPTPILVAAPRVRFRTGRARARGHPHARGGERSFWECACLRGPGAGIARRAWAGVHALASATYRRHG